MSFDWSGFKSDVWKPAQPGDSITGTVTSLEVRDGRGGPVPVVVLETEPGEQVTVWGSPVDLRTQLAALEPNIGSYLRIRFDGERHTGQASPMKLYTVSTPPRPATVDAEPAF